MITHRPLHRRARAVEARGAERGLPDLRRPAGDRPVGRSAACCSRWAGASPAAWRCSLATDPHAAALRLLAPIAPGWCAPVAVASWQRMPAGRAVRGRARGRHRRARRRARAGFRAPATACSHAARERFPHGGRGPLHAPRGMRRACSALPRPTTHRRRRQAPWLATRFPLEQASSCSRPTARCARSASSRSALHDEFATGDIPGFVHLYAGEEAVGRRRLHAPERRRPHRQHAPRPRPLHRQGRATSMAMMAEIFGKQGRLLRRQGRLDAHRRPDQGHARRQRHRRRRPAAGLRRGADGQVRARPAGRVAFFGDGASNQGTFLESLNLAAVWNLPAIFVAENNGYAEATSRDYGVAVGHLRRPRRRLRHARRHGRRHRLLRRATRPPARSIERARDGRRPDACSNARSAASTATSRATRRPTAAPTRSTTSAPTRTA